MMTPHERSDLPKTLDLEALADRAVELLAPHVDQVGCLRVGHRKLSLAVKTGRCSAGGWDDEAQGTVSPTAEADRAAEVLAAEYGLRLRCWDPCEKGWGDFLFEPVD